MFEIPDMHNAITATEQYVRVITFTSGFTQLKSSLTCDLWYYIRLDSLFMKEVLKAHTHWTDCSWPTGIANGNCRPMRVSQMDQCGNIRLV